MPAIRWMQDDMRDDMWGDDMQDDKMYAAHVCHALRDIWATMRSICAAYISHLRGIHLVIAHYLVSVHCGLYARQMHANSTKMRAIHPASARHTFGTRTSFGSTHCGLYARHKRANSTKNARYTARIIALRAEFPGSLQY